MVGVCLQVNERSWVISGSGVRCRVDKTILDIGMGVVDESQLRLPIKFLLLSQEVSYAFFTGQFGLVRLILTLVVGCFYAKDTLGFEDRFQTIKFLLGHTSLCN